MNKGFELLLGALEEINKSGKSISIEVVNIPEENETEVVDEKSVCEIDLNNLDAYLNTTKEMITNKITSPEFKKANVENKIVALGVYDRFRNLDVTKFDAREFNNQMNIIMDKPIDRRDIKQRLAVVSANVSSIACALDAHNPEIIDTMIRMQSLDQYLKDAKPVDEITTDTLMETYVTIESLLETAIEINYNEPALIVKK